MRLAEEKKIVPLTLNTSYSGGVISMDSINMKGYHRADILILCGGVVGDSLLKAYSGATAAALTSTMVFDYAHAGGAIAAASADVLGSTTTAVAATGATMTAATVTEALTIVSVEASNMDVANGEEWLTMTIDSTASSGEITAIAILEPRYTSNKSATALT